MVQIRRIGRKAQAAMEFLMTYGWAILIVLAAIAALAYFGVLSPGKFIPETCTLQPTSGMACLDFRATPTSVHLLLMNSGGRDIVINNITFKGCSASYGLNFPDGSSSLFNITGCSFGSAGTKLKDDMLISYTATSSGFTKTASGSLTVKIY